jgi:hypothetical protein
MINNPKTFPNTSQNISLVLNQRVYICWIGGGFYKYGVIYQVEKISKPGKKKGG